MYNISHQSGINSYFVFGLYIASVKRVRVVYLLLLIITMPLPINSNTCAGAYVLKCTDYRLGPNNKNTKRTVWTILCLHCVEWVFVMTLYWMNVYWYPAGTAINAVSGVIFADTQEIWSCELINFRENWKTLFATNACQYKYLYQITLWS